MNLKPRSERPSINKVIEGVHREVRAIPGVNVFINPIQNLRLGGRVGKSRYQYVYVVCACQGLAASGRRPDGTHESGSHFSRCHQRLANEYVHAKSGALVQLSSIATVCCVFVQS